MCVYVDPTNFSFADVQQKPLLYLINAVDASFLLSRFTKLLQFQLHFPNLKPMFLFVYFYLPIMYHLFRLSSNISVLYFSMIFQ